MGARTTDDLVNDIGARVSRPGGDVLVSSTELLSLVDQEVRTEVASLIVGVRSEFWLASESQSIVSGTSSYRLPDRALAQGLRDVVIVNSNGYEWSSPQLPATDRVFYGGGSSGWSPSGSPFAFSMENGSVVLLPAPTSNEYTLKLRYYARPGKLIAPSAAIFIERPLTTTTLELDNATTAPSTISTVDARVDIVRGDGMHEVIFADRIVDGYAGNTLTLDSTTPIVVADINTSNNLNTRFDYVCPAGSTVYVPVPESVYPFVVALGVRAYAEAIGDMRAFEAAGAVIAAKRKAALDVLQPRVDGEVERVRPRYTPLRGGRRSPWRSL